MIIVAIEISIDNVRVQAAVLQRLTITDTQSTNIEAELLSKYAI